jgi:hypothetical protein
MRRLLTVEDVFEISGRGTVVVPSVAADSRWPASVQLELRRPDGTKVDAVGHVRGEYLYRLPPGKCEFVWMLCFDVPKSAIPSGTEVWAS